MEHFYAVLLKIHILSYLIINYNVRTSLHKGEVDLPLISKLVLPNGVI